MPDRDACASRLRLPCLWALLATGALLLAACGTTAGTLDASGSRVVRVVAAENFWGSIASQIGGSHVQVVSIITNPNTDPHSYEPTAADARTIATAQVVIENGIGYDPWVPKLLSADQASPMVLDVGRLLGVPDGGNPHRWYNPANVQTVIRQLTADFARIDPADRRYFAARAARFAAVALRQYDALIAAIRARYAGTPVGASESIFAMLCPGARPEPGHPAVVPEGDQRGNRGLGGRQADHRPTRSPATRSRSTSTTARTSRLTCRPSWSAAKAAASRSPRSPRRWCRHGQYQHGRPAQLRGYRGRPGQGHRALTRRRGRP